MNTKELTKVVIIASLYSSLTIIVSPISFGLVQVRISEALAPIPYLFGPSGIYGLFIGCLISNFFSPYGLLDVIVGSLSTLIAAWISYKSNKLIQACASPVLVNSIFIGILLHYYGSPLILAILCVGLGESIACIVVGYPLMQMIKKVSTLIEIYPTDYSTP
ncbi:MAG: QueT transporter family protein [Candidatus Helarchaeota archaeon]